MTTPRRLLNPEQSRARRGRVVVLALAAAFALASMSPAPALAGDDMTVEEILKAIEKRAKRNAKIADYDVQTQADIWAEYESLGADKGDFNLAISNVLARQGGKNPFGPEAFQDTVWPLLRDNCRECHAGGGPGFPSIALKDVSAAYDEVLDNGKARLSDPGSSRLVHRLSLDSHHCWGNCDENAAKMELEIGKWADIEESTGGGVGVEAAIVSSSRRMSDGKRNKGKGRADRNTIAKWEFREGEGEIAFDSSGVKPELNLQLNNFNWVSGYGIEFPSRGMALGTKQGSKKLYRMIASPEDGTQQYSVELWVQAENVDQEDSPMLSYSEGGGRTNFAVEQNLYNVVVRNRNKHKKSDKSGMPAMSTADEDEDLQAALQHVVVTYDQYRGRRVFVNGRDTGDKDPVKPEFLWNWDPSVRLVLGNETNNSRRWKGKIRFAAVHKVALSKSEIKKNYKAGVGERFQISFSLNEWFPTGGHSVMFDVREFDESSYTFCDPTFIGTAPLTVKVAGMKLAVNGTISPTGQAFVNVDQTVTSSPKKMSRLCSIIPKENGVDLDRFSVTFRELGQYENVVVTADPPAPDPVDLVEAFPDIGIRDFARINATMSAVTGVPATNNEVEGTYRELTQQLPPSADARSFLSSHQVGISKLALAYCDEMVDNTVFRDAFFGAAPGFDFTADPAVAFASDTEKNEITDIYYDEMIGTGLANQPTRSQIRSAIGGLMDTLVSSCQPGCAADRTEVILKVTCAAVLSSATTAIQ